MSELSWESIEQEIADCRRCGLCEQRHRIVLGEGNRNAEIMLVGEGPGADEDAQGLAFVGRAGQLLTKMLEAIGLKREDVFICNIVKCRPAGNRTPSVEEGEFCAARWLDAEIAVVQPKVIVALGSVALKYLYHAKARITADRGKWFRTRHDIPAIATYHPAYLLRLTGDDERRAKWDVVHDFEAAITEINKIAPDWSLKTTPPPDLLSLYAARRNERRALATSVIQE